jgi:hypothetical protein
MSREDVHCELPDTQWLSLALRWQKGDVAGDEKKTEREGERGTNCDETSSLVLRSSLLSTPGFLSVKHMCDTGVRCSTVAERTREKVGGKGL